MRVAGPVDSVRQAAGDASVVRRAGARRSKHARWPRAALCTDGGLRRGAREKTTFIPHSLAAACSLSWSRAVSGVVLLTVGRVGNDSTVSQVFD